VVVECVVDDDFEALVEVDCPKAGTHASSRAADNSAGNLNVRLTEITPLPHYRAIEGADKLRRND
jgi:hypothetical protein